MCKSIILYKEAGPTYVLRTNSKAPEILELMKTLNKPYKLKIITNDLTIIRLGFKMVSRQCIGGIYIKEVY